jgi:DHA1 family bicyclomycin/chloramphenicol resistance-like MFS transporter
MTKPLLSVKETRPPDTHRGASLILILGALTAFGALSIDMYLPAFPKIASTFSVPESQVELSLTSFFVGMALGQLIYGPLADRFGRKPPLFFGLFLYSVFSAACSLAPTMEALIVFRFFQALGACAGIVIARAVVRDLFKSHEAARVFSLLMLVLGIAPILAPLLGGYIATFSTWRAIFWIHASFGALCIVSSVFVLPHTRRADQSVRLTRVFHTYFGILRNKEFLGYALSGSLAQAGMFAYITGSPFVFIHLFGIQARHYGWIFGLNAIGLILSAQLNVRLLRIYNPNQILQRTLFFIAIFGLLLGISGLLGAGLWMTAPCLFVYLSLLGMTFPNTAAGALAQHGASAGSASALLGSLQFIIAFLASIAVSFFHDGTSLPMTVTIGICGALSFMNYHLFIHVASNKDRRGLFFI